MDNTQFQLSDTKWIIITNDIFYLADDDGEYCKINTRLVLNAKNKDTTIGYGDKLIFFNERNFGMRIDENEKIFLFKCIGESTYHCVGSLIPHYEYIIKRFFRNNKLKSRNNKSIYQRRTLYKKQIIDEKKYSKFVEEELRKERAKNTKLNIKLRFIKQRFLDQLQDLECPICMENKEAQFLDCCHTVCPDCYEKITTCPLCRY